MNKTLPDPIAVGRTAEIFPWKDNQVLKLYRDWCPPDWVEHEAFIARVVNQAGISAPQAGDVVEVNGRRGILYERVEGPDMLDSIRARTSRLLSYGRTLAQLHLEMHRAQAPDLPSMRGSLEGSIRAAPGLPEPLREKALARLAALPEDTRLCHGDFHPGNVLLTTRGPMVIDWMTATRGHPAADVARTRLLLTIGDPPQGGILRVILLLVRGLFVQTYLRTYRAQSPEVVKLSDAFMPIMAAARMNEDIKGERKRLIKKIE